MRQWIALVIVASACGSGADEPPPGLTATWSFVDATGAGVGCPTGYDQVVVYHWGPHDGADSFDTFPCAAGATGVLDTLPAEYELRIEVRNDAGEPFAGSRVLAAVLPEDPTARVNVDEQFVVDGGRVQVSIALRTAAETDCAGAGVARVRVRITDGLRSFEESFPCEAARQPNIALTRPLPPALYEVVLEALDAAGQPRATSHRVPVTVGSPNGYGFALGIPIQL